MHELSIAEALVQSAAAWCRENRRKALALKIAIGRIGGVDPEALKIAWPMALDVADNPDLTGCRLELEVLPLRFGCTQCGAETEAERLIWVCPSCGGESLRRKGGCELLLQSIEVEDV